MVKSANESNFIGYYIRYFFTVKLPSSIKEGYGEVLACDGG